MVGDAELKKYGIPHTKQESLNKLILFECGEGLRVFKCLQTLGFTEKDFAYQAPSISNLKYAAVAIHINDNGKIRYTKSRDTRQTWSGKYDIAKREKLVELQKINLKW